jgi:phage-related tail protein
MVGVGEIVGVGVAVEVLVGGISVGIAVGLEVNIRLGVRDGMVISIIDGASAEQAVAKRMLAQKPVIIEAHFWNFISQLLH